LSRLIDFDLQRNQLVGTIPVFPNVFDTCFLGNNCFASPLSNAQAAGCSVSPNCP